MIRLLVLGLLALAAEASAQSASRPTRAALQRVAESCGPSLVIVEHPSGRGPGVVVGAQGEILTATHPTAPLRDTRVRFGEVALGVEPVLDDPNTGLRVLRAIDAAAHALAAVPLQPTEALEPGHWVIALVRRDGAWVSLPLQLSAARGASSPHVQLSAALPLGTPLFDARGRLVAAVVRRGVGKRVLVQPLGPLRRSVAAETPP